MRRLAVATLALLAVAGTADAAPRKVCKLLGAGERTVTYLPETDPAEEVRSADLASNKTHLTAVVRLGSAEDSVGPVDRGRVVKFFFSRSVEQGYFFEVTVFGTKVYRTEFGTMSAPYRTDENEAGLADFETVTKDVRVVVDTARDEVRMTIPLSHFRLAPGGVPKQGTRMRFLAVELHRIYGFNRDGIDGYPADGPRGFTQSRSIVAGNDKVSYALGTPSCVAVGR